MELTTRRKFCGTAIMALPTVAVLAKAKTIDFGDSSDSPDPIFNSIADEFTRITIDGAQKGYKSEHFRGYAGIMKILDAQMENKGINKETDQKLDEDDFYKSNPIRSAKSVSDYWRKWRIEIREDELIERMVMDGKSYHEWKKAIKKKGGVRALHVRIASAFEQKAKEYETSALRTGPSFQQGRIWFPRQEEKPFFLKAQQVTPDDVLMRFISEDNIAVTPSSYEIYNLAISMGFGGVNLDCLCKGMVVEGIILSMACLSTICAPCCVPAALLVAIEKIMEGFSMCSPNRCS
jgi:hypothetical protein